MVLLTTEFGKYFPNYLVLHLNTDHGLNNILDLSPEDFRTLIHEYTHFLQNITGCYGFSTIGLLFEKLARIINEIQESKGNQILVPFNSKKQEVSNKVLRSIYGSNSLKEIDDSQAQIKSINFYKSTELEELVGSNKVDFINLIIEDTTGKTENYHFGECAVSETMAFLMECKFFGYGNLKNFPYRACQKLGQFLKSSFVDDDELLFAICDLSLSYPYPGYSFYILLIDLEREKSNISRPEDIYVLGRRILAGRGYIFEELLEKNKNWAVDSFQRIHFHDNIFFSNLKVWFEHLISMGYYYRRKDPHFLLTLYREGNIASEKWKEVVCQFGFPQIYNIKYDRYFNGPRHLEEMSNRVEPFFLLALREIENTLINGSFRCSLLEFCRNSKTGDLTNYDCVTQPWKIKPDQNLCAYKAYWRIFGLDKKEIIFGSETN